MLSFELVAAVAVVIVFLLIAAHATMTVTTSWTIVEDGEGTGQGASASVAVTGNDILSTNCAVPVSTTNAEFDVYIDCSTMKGLVITSNTDVTIYTNEASTGAPDDTLTIKANIPFTWVFGSGVTRPINGDTNIINKVFITNASAVTAAVVKFRGVQTV